MEHGLFKPMIPLIAYSIFCIIFAYLNYIEIVKLDERIWHGLNGTIHLATALYFTLAVSPQMGFSILLVARLSFDISLNLFRGLPINYVPTEPKSIVDKIEIFLFEDNGWLPKIIYLLLLTAFNV
jgi:hypothetical protein